MSKTEQAKIEALEGAMEELQRRVLMLDRTLGSGLMGTLVLMEMLATAQDKSQADDVRDKALKDAQETMSAMRRGFGGG